MKQYFSKQIGNCCQLNFSNQVVKSQRILLIPKTSSQIPINFTRKQQKKSLKRICSERVINLKDNKNQQILTNYNKGDNKKKDAQQMDDYGGRRNDTKGQNQFQYGRLQNPAAYYKLTQNHKSLERQPTRQQHPKLITIHPNQNPLQQLRSYRNINNPPISKPPKIQFTPAHLYESTRFLGNNFSQTVMPNCPTALVHGQEMVASSDAGKCKLAQASVSNCLLGKQIVAKRTPVKTRHHQESYLLSKPPKIKPALTAYTESFKQIYGQVQLQDQIKLDLMTSIQFQKRELFSEHKFDGIPIYIKGPSSQESTMMHSKAKLRKKLSLGESFDSTIYYNQIRAQEQVKDRSSNLFVNDYDFKEQCQRRQNFKSIISINSQHDSTQSVDSVIIHKLPKQNVSSKPIRSLL